MSPVPCLAVCLDTGVVCYVYQGTVTCEAAAGQFVLRCADMDKQSWS